MHGEVSRMNDLVSGLKEKLEDLVDRDLISVRLGGGSDAQFYTPENQKRLLFSYHSPKIVSVLGRAAEQNWRESGVVRGVLVKKDLKYQIVAEEDIDKFTQLKLCRILYRQHFKTRLDFNAVLAVAALLTNRLRVDSAARSLCIDEAITVRQHAQQNHVFEFLIEWRSSYETDLKANAFLMLVLQQDANVLSPLVSPSSARYLSRTHRCSAPRGKRATRCRCPTACPSSTSPRMRRCR